MKLAIIPDRHRRRWYVYAWRGGPRIHVHEGPRKPTRAQLPPAALRALAEALENRFAEPAHLFLHVIREWQRSGDWERLEGSTRKVWQGHLNLVEAKWGGFPYTVWDDPRMASKVVKWRDERKATPRTADIGVTVLRALLKWAKLNGFVAINAAADIPQLGPSPTRLGH